MDTATTTSRSPIVSLRRRAPPAKVAQDAIHRSYPSFKCFTVSQTDVETTPGTEPSQEFDSIQIPLLALGPEALQALDPPEAHADSSSSTDVTPSS